MFRLYKNFKVKDWIGVILIIGFTFLQVYLTMTLIDYVQGIIKAITYVNYHNNPIELGQEISNFISTYGWETIKQDGFLQNLGLPQETIDVLLNVADASTSDIWFNGGMMILLAALLMLVQALISLIASLVAANLTTTIRGKVYSKVESFSLSEINKISTPSLITRTTNDIQNIQMANLMTMRMIFAAPITAVWAIIKIQASSSELTLATAIAIIILLVVIAALMVLALPKFKVMQVLTDNLNGTIRENLKGIRIIRAFNAEKYQEDKFTKSNNEFTNAQIFIGKVMSVLSPAMMIVMNGISLAIYWIGASLINKGTIDYPTITAFMTLSSQIIMSFVMLMMLFILWPRAIVSAKRINEVLDLKSSIKDIDNPKMMITSGEIEFKNVSFKYPQAENYSIENISFKAHKGETIAIIGATGSGKTSIINLIPRLYDVTDGEVIVNGVNVKELPQKELRSKIGYVPQKGFLFKGNIKENVSLGHPELSYDSIVEACKIAEADTFINEKNEKYDFEVAQGGKNVSGGQRQRLCIARAVSFKTEILIFDDSFSALDYKTDKKVRENLKNEMTDATKIIVAQRVGTIMDADQIIVLDEGKIVGIGKHQELLNNCSVYLEIALSQLTKEELGLC